MTHTSPRTADDGRHPAVDDIDGIRDRHDMVDPPVDGEQVPPVKPPPWPQEGPGLEPVTGR